MSQIDMAKVDITQVNIAQVGMTQVGIAQVGTCSNGSLKRCFDAVVFLIVREQNFSIEPVFDFDLHFSLLR
jgi:hypothetical protein